MNRMKFMYESKNGSKSERDVIVFHNYPDSIHGIDLNSLKPEEQEKAIKIMEKFDEDIKPYYSAFRKFDKSKVVLNEG